MTNWNQIIYNMFLKTLKPFSVKVWSDLSPYAHLFSCTMISTLWFHSGSLELSGGKKFIKLSSGHGARYFVNLTLTFFFSTRHSAVRWEGIKNLQYSEKDIPGHLHDLQILYLWISLLIEEYLSPQTNTWSTFGASHNILSIRKSVSWHACS